MGVTVSKVINPIFKDEENIWQVQGYQEAKTLMKSLVTQAGFGTESLRDNPMIETPIPALDGEEHRQRRSQVARFFTPQAANQRYYEAIEKHADYILNTLEMGQPVDVREISTTLANDVVCEILGLQYSIRDGLVDRFLEAANIGDIGSLSLSPRELAKMVRTFYQIIAFWLYDIRPSVKAHRQHDHHDLISYMLDRDASMFSIMMECIAYGLAGVLTTREFIQTVLMLCLQNPQYKAIMLSDDSDTRIRFLHEVLRLYPVTAHLTRRATEDLEIISDDKTIHISKGDLIRFNIGDINLDEREVGADTHNININRDFTSRIMWSMFAFGHGHHRCPGEYLAIVETDILLQKLLQYNIEVITYPEPHYNVPSANNGWINFMIRLQESANPSGHTE